MSSAILRRALFPRATAKTPSLLSPISTYAASSPDETAVSTAVKVLTHRRSKSRWSTLLSLFPHGFSPPQISQILLEIRNNPHLAQNFFNFATCHSPSSPPTLHCYATIIHILGRAHLKSRALTLLKEALRISELGDRRRLKIFRELVQTYRVCDSSPIVFDLFIRSLFETNKLDPCIEIVRLLRSRGFSPHVKIYNALIMTALGCKGCFFGYDLYRELFGFTDDCDDNGKRGGKCKVLPNVHTFNELMLAFHRNGLVDMVEELWIEMSRLKCIPNVCSYSILMAVYCEEGDVEKATNVWEELIAKGLKPDIVAYNTLIGGYCRTGETLKGEELCREMGLSGLEGTCVTYQHLINGYCLAGDADYSMLLYKDMRRKGFSPDSSSVDSMVRLLCDKKSASQALEFFRNVMENTDFVARETSYEFLIRSLCNEGKMEEALKLQAQMVGKGFRPNSRVYGAFVDGYVKQGKRDVAERLRKEMMTTQAW